MKGVNPAWANLPRRKCDDCGGSYKPKQPLREGTRGFCSDNCRKSYHKHGGAYRKLKPEVAKLIQKELKPLQAEIRELRQLWIENELLYMELKGKIEALESKRTARR
jgi:NADH:ubiquinone oxidoreductase subunit D